MSSRKGQAIIQGFFIFFFLLVVVAILLNPIEEFIDIGINNTSNSTHGDLIQTLFEYLPVFIVIVLFMAFLALTSVR